MKLYCIAKLDDTLKTMGVSEDIINFITQLPDKDKGFFMGYLKKNPNTTLEELQKYKPEQKVDPYSDYEHRFSNGITIPEIKTWYLVNARKARKGRPQPNANGDFDPDYNRFHRFVDFRLVEDWYRNTNPKPDIASMDMNAVINAEQEWHRMISGKGEGKVYEPTKPELVIYGPKWKNPKLQGWTIQEVRSKNDLDAEGNKMKHCVGSYYNQVADGHTRIFSLRDPQNNPHVTIETDSAGTSFNQIKGQSNGEPKDEYKAMIKEWVQSRGIKSYSTDGSDAIDDYYGGYTEDMVGCLEDIIKSNETNEYGLAVNNVKDIDVENMIEKIIEQKSREHRRSSDYDYHGAITKSDRLFIDLAMKVGKEKYNDPIKGLYELEKSVNSIEEKNNEDFYSNWDFDYWEKSPDEDDFETNEGYQKAYDEWQQKRDEAESEQITEIRRNWSKYALPDDILGILQAMREKKEYPQWEKLVKKYEPKKKPAKVASNWYSTAIEKE